MNRRHPVFTFYLVVTILTLLGTVLNYVFFPGNGWFEWIILYSPALAGIVLTGVLDGPAGVSALFSRALRWRISWKWYAATFVLPITFSLGWVFLNTLVDGQGVFVGWANLVSLAQGLLRGGPGLLIMAAMMVILIAGEEIGWRGFALERLLRNTGYGLLATAGPSLIVGTFWGLWHVPTIFDPGSALNQAPLFISIPIFTLGTIIFSLVYTWFWQNTNGSLLQACLFHAFYNLINFFTANLFPAFYPRFWFYLIVLLAIMVPVWWLGGWIPDTRRPARSAPFDQTVP